MARYLKETGHTFPSAAELIAETYDNLVEGMFHTDVRASRQKQLEEIARQLRQVIDGRQ